MKTLNRWLFVIVALFVGTAFAMAADAPAGEALPQTKSDLWKYAISAVTPIIVWLVTLVAPKIPKVLLPTATPLVGIGLGLLLNKLGASNLGWVDMAQAGALAVFIREVVNQAITKQLSPPTS